MIKKIADFFHIIDDDGRLDLSDLAFMIIMGKVVMAVQLDWPSVVTLGTVLANKIHKRHDRSLPDTDSGTADLDQVQQQAAQLQNAVNTVTPVIKQIKESL